MEKGKETESLLEKFIEGMLWRSRYIVFLAVFFSVTAAISLFVFGSYEIVAAILNENPFTAIHEHGHADLLVQFIGAVDLYLIGIVLLIFGFGIYELFISEIDVARDNNYKISILEIKTLDELKNKIIKVIIMVLIVTFFERVLNMKYDTPIHMLFFAVSILILATGVFMINKHPK